jgi:hypothetical protein
VTLINSNQGPKPRHVSQLIYLLDPDSECRIVRRPHPQDDFQPTNFTQNFRPHPPWNSRRQNWAFQCDDYDHRLLYYHRSWTVDSLRLKRTHYCLLRALRLLLRSLRLDAPFTRGPDLPHSRNRGAERDDIPLCCVCWVDREPNWGRAAFE